MYGDGRASPSGSPNPRVPYPGTRRKLIVAFDLGTTFSGVSYRVNLNIPPLPPGKTVVEVVADFISYLLKCTANFIRDTHRFGDDSWLSFISATQSPEKATNDDIHWVLGHPNGWEGKEQAQMRGAAVKAGLIPDTPEGHERISFVMEGEASLHFAVRNDLLLDINDDEGIIVVDAGGGTIDISIYEQQQGQKTKNFKGLSSAKCRYNGSVFITAEAKCFLEILLSESSFLENLDHIASCFDKTTKLRFRNDEDPQFIRFGSRSDNVPDVNIRFGQIKLDGVDIAKFFQASIDSVLQIVQAQKKKARQTHVVLVVGFSASFWLFDRVRNILAKIGMTVTRPKDNAVKAVSDGAVSFYLDRHVRTRVAKVTYGSPCSAPFDSKNLEHRKRLHASFTDVNDIVYIPQAFKVILAKGTQVTEDEKFSHPFVDTSLHPNLKFNSAINCYREGNVSPEWVDIDSGNYTPLFRLQADLSRVPRRPQVNLLGRRYYKAESDVVIMFGRTELKAYLRWEENGVVKQSPAKLIYD
ncbi:hypothetical protein CPB83DRAFT_868945 [Crepidotus variabilis]|uniref:Hsp70 family chaperone n=1 Tax=Crepidotus variabilis TaxID=179855 RepID=A0A9P6JRQ7_9AGAR|nr:hypothetical protein CPB83DRAFT_868945 [Crepidotus variabilis]